MSQHPMHFDRLSQLPWIGRCGLAVLLGALGTLGFAAEDNIPRALLGSLISLAAWSGLFILLDSLPFAAQARHRAKQSAWLASSFGMGLFGTGVSWIYISLHTYGGMSVALAGLATALFCAVLTLLPALFGWLYGRLRSSTQPPFARALLFASLWAVTEWIRSWLFTGFPWLSLGYSQLPPSPLAGYFPLLGIFGVSLLTALSAAGLVSGRRGQTFVLGIWIGGVGLHSVAWTQAGTEQLPYALIQGNIPQDLKWDPERFRETLKHYQEKIVQALDDASQPRLIVLPETALPALLEDIPVAYLQALDQAAREHQATLIIGAPTTGTRSYQNSAMTLGSGAGQVYHKQHLVPFGEFIPPGFHAFLKLANIPMADFQPGDEQQAPLRIAGVPIAANICYEDCFSEPLALSARLAGAMLNLSNIAWFGDSQALPQHLQMARARALENGRPMLRATNTGMTAAILPNGQVINALPPMVDGTLLGTLTPFFGTTPYGRWGNQAFFLITGAFLLIALRRR